MNIHKALLSGYIAIDRIASRTRFTGEEVIQLLDPDGEDGGMEDTFFPGSDEELCICVTVCILRQLFSRPAAGFVQVRIIWLWLSSHQQEGIPSVTQVSCKKSFKVRGQSVTQQHGNLTVSVWQENKPVVVIATNADPTMNDKVSRKQRRVFVVISLPHICVAV